MAKTLVYVTIGIISVVFAMFFVNAQVNILYRDDIVDFWNAPFWSQIPDKPSSFPPSLHSHTLTHLNITDWSNYVNSTLNDWNYLTNKPSTFPPSVHSHTLSSANITNWGTYINQALLISSHPSFNGLTVTDTLIMDGDKIAPSVTYSRILLVGGSGGAIGGAYIGLYGTTNTGQEGRLEFQSGLVNDVDAIMVFYTPDTTPSYQLRMRINAGALGSSGIIMYEPLTVSGLITGNSGIVTQYMSGDYGLTWTQSMPSGVNGLTVVVYNSNSGILSSRLYVYTNGAWHFIAIT